MDQHLHSRGRTAVFIAGIVALLGLGMMSLIMPGPGVTDAPVRAAAGIQPLPANEIAQAAREIDRLVDAGLGSAGQQPNPRTDDEQFLRRTYLQLIGRIPTHDEAAAFLADGSAGKRAALVTSLIGSEGWVSNEFTFWADLLRVETRMMNQTGQPYIDWVKNSLRANKSYDRMVRELLTAEGPALAPDNGATGFWLRDKGMPLDHMANTVRVFLGTQIGCAQCHDHPFDVWTRAQFYEMSAFTAGTAVQSRLAGESAAMGPEARAKGKAMKELYEKATPAQKNALRLVRETIGLRVQDTGKWHLNLPRDYQYQDHKPNELVAARTIFGESPELKQYDRDGRARFAAWMASPTNPRFTTVIANRMWKRAFGLGLIEPLDNLTDKTAAANPELLAYLERLMVGVGYDLRRFEEILCSTAAWQRQATRVEVKAGEPYLFPGPVLRRMSAEQAWDSLLTLVVPDLDARHGDDASKLVEFYNQNKDKKPEELVELAMGIADARTQGQELQKQFQALRAQMRTATGQELQALREQQKQLNQRREELLDRSDLVRPKMLGKNKNPNGREIFLRASELPQPAPQGHFLRVFGQSDRELIDNRSLAATPTQALFLLNGLIDNELLKGTSQFTVTLKAAGAEPRAQVAALFLCIYSRMPHADELALGMRLVQENPQGGLKDLAWALVNSHEFLFIQ